MLLSLVAIYILWYISKYIGITIVMCTMVFLKHLEVPSLWYMNGYTMVKLKIVIIIIRVVPWYYGINCATDFTSSSVENW